MAKPCPTLEELAAWVDLPANDTRRSHLQHCPRCQAVVASYGAFMDPENLPAGADLQDARQRLSASLDREIGVGGVGDVVRPAAARWRPFSRSSVAAVAAVMVVALGLSLMRGRIEGPPQRDVLRGGPDPAAAFSGDIMATDTAGYRLSWPAAADPTATYRIVVYGADLTEVARLEAGGTTSIELTPPAAAAFCQVVVLLHGDEVTRSGPIYFADD